MTKYIFLDFDGVLNTEQYQAQCQLMGLPVSDKYGPHFSQKAIRNLQRLIDETGAEVVIISSWRYIMLHDKLRKMWKDRHLPEAIIHILDPDKKMYDISKGDQIANFMSVRKNNPYVILDDEWEFLDSQLSHLIHINPVNGIKKRNVEAGIMILNQS